MKKKLISVLLTGVLTAGILTGCAGSGSGQGGAAAGTAPSAAAGTAEAASETASEAAPSVVEDAATTGTAEDGELQVITIAASPTPHAEILEEASTLLEEKGYELEVTEFEDYVQPNEVVESEEFDANYFQHITYLNNFNEEKGTHLVSAGKIHYEPFGIYPGAKEDLKDIADGDAIAVPNDTTNEARALLLLQDLDLIKLSDGAGLTATKNDIVENPHNLEIQELEAAQIPHAIQDVAFAVMNGNYAMEAGYTVATDALGYEKADSEAAKNYVNVIAVKEGHESDPGIKALVEVLKSDEMKTFLNETYEGSVIPSEEAD